MELEEEEEEGGGGITSETRWLERRGKNLALASTASSG
jgi:hypothetical protein